MDKLGLQLYTVRGCFKTEEQADETLKKLIAMGISKVQLSSEGISVPELKKICDKNGLITVGTSYSLDKILHDTEDTMAYHKALGINDIGISFLPPPLRESKEILLNFIDEVNAAAKIYAKHGFKVSYHHHHFEFMRIDGTKTLLDYLIEKLDPETTRFILDTCWIAAGGGDVRHYIEKLAGRIDIIHLKDMQFINKDDKFVATYTEVGNGSLYWDGIIKTAEDAKIPHFIIEQDGNFIEGDPFKSVKASTDYLKRYMK